MSFQTNVRANYLNRHRGHLQPHTNRDQCTYSCIHTAHYQCILSKQAAKGLDMRVLGRKYLLCAAILSARLCALLGHVQVRVGVAAIFWVGEGFDCSVEIR